MNLISLLEKDIPVKQYLQQYDEKLRAAQGIVICGLGEMSRFAFEYLQARHMTGKIVGVRDQRYAKDHIPAYKGYPILDDLQIQEQQKSLLFICTPKKKNAYHGCVKDLESLCIDKSRILPAIDGCFFLDNDLLRHRTLNIDEIKENSVEFQKAYGMLEDELSKQVFLAMLHYKITGNIEFLVPVAKNYSSHGFDEEFFDPQAHDRFVDLGAYDGDTAQEYIYRTDGKYQSIYCFEPDPVNFQKLEAWAILGKHKNVNIYCLAAGATKKSALFSAVGKECSNISENGNTTIQVDSVDHILQGENVNYIKFDVEGAEYDALLGLEKTIQKFKPTLCVSCYHLKTDFFQLPMLIRKLSPCYRLYMRQYLLRCTATELYAVPY